MKSQVANFSDWYHGTDRAEMLDYVKADAKTVLEIGCGAGAFAGLLKRKIGAEMWGIELSDEAASVAKDVLDVVKVGTADAILPTLPLGKFDYVICNDVLEHMIDPVEVLRELKKHLSPTGKIVASIPNIRFIGALRHIVCEKDFEYVDCGIFDRTHLRFFTKKSIQRMFEDAGYRLVKLEGLDPEEGYKKAKLWKLVNALSFIKLFDDVSYLQFACVAEAVK